MKIWNGNARQFRLSSSIKRLKNLRKESAKVEFSHLNIFLGIIKKIS